FPKVPQSSPIMPEQLQFFLKVLQKFPGATIGLLAKEADVSERMVKKYLKLLREQGTIRRIGSNRKGYWEITEE
ncbi:MAG: HTH domain-containing protein, partial [Prevotellaceae bacterium]|nr:HTH domain-containing protein [Prevotellaceae bacterium]